MSTHRKSKKKNFFGRRSRKPDDDELMVVNSEGPSLFGMKDSAPPLTDLPPMPAATATPKLTKVLPPPALPSQPAKQKKTSAAPPGLSKKRPKRDRKKQQAKYVPPAVKTMESSPPAKPETSEKRKTQLEVLKPQQVIPPAEEAPKAKKAPKRDTQIGKSAEKAATPTKKVAKKSRKKPKRATQAAKYVPKEEIQPKKAPEPKAEVKKPDPVKPKKKSPKRNRKQQTEIVGPSVKETVVKKADEKPTISESKPEEAVTRKKDEKKKTIATTENSTEAETKDVQDKSKQTIKPVAKVTKDPKRKTKAKEETVQTRSRAKSRKTEIKANKRKSRAAKSKSQAAPIEAEMNQMELSAGDIEELIELPPVEISAERATKGKRFSFFPGRRSHKPSDGESVAMKKELKAKEKAEKKKPKKPKRLRKNDKTASRAKPQQKNKAPAAVVGDKDKSAQDDALNHMLMPSAESPKTENIPEVAEPVRQVEEQKQKAPVVEKEEIKIPVAPAATKKNKRSSKNEKSTRRRKTKRLSNPPALEDLKLLTPSQKNMKSSSKSGKKRSKRISQPPTEADLATLMPSQKKRNQELSPTAVKKTNPAPVAVQTKPSEETKVEKTPAKPIAVAPAQELKIEPMAPVIETLSSPPAKPQAEPPIPPREAVKVNSKREIEPPLPPRKGIIPVNVVQPEAFGKRNLPPKNAGNPHANKMKEDFQKKDKFRMSFWQKKNTDDSKPKKNFRQSLALLSGSKKSLRSRLENLDENRNGGKQAADMRKSYQVGGKFRASFWMKKNTKKTSEPKPVERKKLNNNLKQFAGLLENTLNNKSKGGTEKELADVGQLEVNQGLFGDAPQTDDTGKVDYTKYTKMHKVGLPQGPIRQAMYRDKLEDSDIDFFFENIASNPDALDHTAKASPEAANGGASGPPAEIQLLEKAGDVDYAKYIKMKKVGMPEGAIIHAMNKDELAQDNMDFFLANIEHTELIKSPDERNPKLKLPEKRGDADYEKYKKLYKMRVPEIAVRLAMEKDGLTEDNLEFFFANVDNLDLLKPLGEEESANGEVVVAKPGFLADIEGFGSKGLKKKSRSLAPRSSKKASMKRAATLASVPNTPSGGLMGELQNTLKRRKPTLLADRNKRKSKKTSNRMSQKTPEGDLL